MNNHIYNGMLQTFDGGGIFTSFNDGVGTEISYNIVHDVKGTGIYLDNNSRNFLVHHNIIYNTGTGVTLNAPNNPDTIPKVNYKIYNNTIDPAKCSTCVSMTSYTASSNSVLSGSEIINNIFTARSTMKYNLLSSAALQPIYQNNLCGFLFSLAELPYYGKPGSQNTGNIISTNSVLDPYFVSPYSSANPNKNVNYSLQPISDALKLSKALPELVSFGAYEVRFNGVSQGVPAGACEINSSWTAGASLPEFDILPINGCGH